MIIRMKILSTKSDSKATAGNLSAVKLCLFCQKSLISVVQESNLLVDIIPVFPGIFSQSFPVHQPRFFHNFCNSEIPLSGSCCSARNIA